MKLFKKVKEIKSKKSGEIHFRRYAIIETKPFSIYLHYFTRCDKDLHEHDHPWNFFLIILKGGYIEKSNGNYKMKTPLSMGYFKAEHSHQIVELNKKSSWSLAFVGRRKREWGYNTENGWVDNKTYREMKHRL